MIADILMALVCSLMFQLFGLIEGTIKSIMSLLCYITLIVVYLCNNNVFNFIGTMDFAVWLLVIAMFNTIFDLLERGFKRLINESEKEL